MFTVVDAKTYHKELVASLSKAKHRICMASMVFLWDDRTEDIYKALHDAVLRGVSVTIISDTYNNSLFAYNPFTPRRLLEATSLRRTSRDKMQILEKDGATVHYIGTMHLNPYKGRFHQKFSVIDDTVYIGGINIDGSVLDSTDVMVKVRNDDLAEYLASSLLPARDTSLAINSSSTLLVDSGKPHQSLIYDTVVELSKNAHHITYVSQRAPSGILAKILKEKDTTYYYTRPSQMHDPALLSQWIDQTRYGIPNSYARSSYLHAKYILFTMHDESKSVIVGSHNFTYQGVAYGTKEMAIISSDPSLFRQLQSFTQSAIH